MAVLKLSSEMSSPFTQAHKWRMPAVWDWTLTTAEVNGTSQGGINVVPAVPGMAFMPIDVAWQCTGSAAGATLLRVADDDNNVVMSHVVADCTNGTWVGRTGGTVVVTKLGFPTAANKGLKFQPTAADLTTTTAVRLVIVGFYL